MVKNSEIFKQVDRAIPDLRLNCWDDDSLYECLGHMFCHCDDEVQAYIYKKVFS